MGSNSATLFDETTIDSLPWPDTEEGQRARLFITPLIKQGATTYFDNVHVEVRALKIDQLILPITISNRRSGNCYVCSPYGQYVTCAQEYLRNHLSAPFSTTLGPVFRCLGKFLHWAEIDKTIFVDNWLISTNLHPTLGKEMIKSIVEKLIHHFPDRAIAFRSVHDQEFSKELSKTGFNLIASRPVYLLDASSKHPFQSRMFKSDLKLFEQTDYNLIEGDEISLKQVPRLLSLYEDLYVHKYSRESIRFNKKFLTHAIKNKLLSFRAFEKGGKIDAVVGYFCRGGVMTSPFLGYDLSLPQKLGLYRLISTALTLEAKKKGVLLHQSSGASSFKKLRRAKPVMESMAVYHSHLPRWRRTPWKTIQGALNTVGIPLLNCYEK